MWAPLSFTVPTPSPSSSTNKGSRVLRKSYSKNSSVSWNLCAGTNDLRSLTNKMDEVNVQLL